MTTIFTMTHKKFQAVENPIYRPLHVGKAVGKDLRYQGDDTGDSISHLNCYYGELTGIYWIWKNYQTDGNIGICHYRRFFYNKNKELMTEEEYDEILSEYDIITSTVVLSEAESYREEYAKAHNIRDLEETAKIIERLYPRDYQVFCDVINGREKYFGNLMVAEKKVFDEYCEWLFSIFFELEKVIDVSEYDEYHKRVFGFLSEQLLMVWVRARGLNVYECNVAITAEKAETVELKQSVAYLVKQNRITEARQLFYEVLKVRPDVQLELSDMKQEIFIIEQLLYICEEENELSDMGMLAYSNDLTRLIEHYYKVVEILKRYPDYQAVDISYLKDTKVTGVAVAVIAMNHGELAGRWKEIVENLYGKDSGV